MDGTKQVLGLFRCGSVAVAALIAVDEGARARSECLGGRMDLKEKTYLHGRKQSCNKISAIKNIKQHRPSLQIHNTIRAQIYNKTKIK